MAKTRALRKSSVSPLIPADLKWLFDQRPVVKTEDQSAYDALVTRMIAETAPEDTMEWIWIKDLADLTWELIRYRRAKTHLMQFWQRSALSSVALIISPRDPLLPGELAREYDSEGFEGENFSGFSEAFGIHGDTIMGHALVAWQHEVQAIDQLMARTEMRRAAIGREIERHREFARRVHKITAAIDAEPVEATLVPPQAPASILRRTEQSDQSESPDDVAA
jgi:hypothetical protein